MRYHHGVALFEAGKLAEARTAFDQAVQGSGVKPIGAEAALKGLQCSVRGGEEEDRGHREGEAEAELECPANRRHRQPQPGPRTATSSNFARQLEQKAEHFRAALPQSEARARMLYDAAWAYRAAGDGRVNGLCTNSSAEFADLSLAVEARLELAELLVDAEQTGRCDQAPPRGHRQGADRQADAAETLERVRLRLGGVLFEKKDYAAAQGQFDAVAANEKSPHRGQGLYRSAECLLVQGKNEEAKNKLVIFRDNGAFHNIAGRQRPRRPAARPCLAGTQAVGAGPTGVSRR